MSTKFGIAPIITLIDSTADGLTKSTTGTGSAIVSNNYSITASSYVADSYFINVTSWKGKATTD